MLVAYHVVGPDRFTGMRVADTSMYRTVIADGPLLIRMPLFTFLSGYVYAYRPVRSRRVGTFVSKKVRRLLIPMVVASTVAALLQSVVPSTNAPIDLSELWRIYIWPFGHYWYLPALFIIFVAMVVLDRFRLIETPRSFLVALAAASGLYFLAPHAPTVFGLDFAMYLSPFFLWGVGVHSFGQRARSRTGRGIAITIGLLAIAANVIVLWLDVDVSPDRISPLGLVVGLCATLGIAVLGLSSRWLARLGTYSYAIYLYHVFGTAGSRILVRKVIDASPVIFTLSLLGGVIFPIVVAEAARRNRWSRLMLLGESTTNPSRRVTSPAATSVVGSNRALGT